MELMNFNDIDDKFLNDRIVEKEIVKLDFVWKEWKYIWEVLNYFYSQNIFKINITEKINDDVEYKKINIVVGCEENKVEINWWKLEILIWILYDVLNNKEIQKLRVN